MGRPKVTAALIARAELALQLEPRLDYCPLCASTCMDSQRGAVRLCETCLQDPELTGFQPNMPVYCDGGILPRSSLETLSERLYTSSTQPSTVQIVRSLPSYELGPPTVEVELTYRRHLPAPRSLVRVIRFTMEDTKQQMEFPVWVVTDASR